MVICTYYARNVSVSQWPVGQRYKILLNNGSVKTKKLKIKIWVNLTPTNYHLFTSSKKKKISLIYILSLQTTVCDI
jgi:hypothetical protein